MTVKLAKFFYTSKLLKRTSLNQCSIYISSRFFCSPAFNQDLSIFDNTEVQNYLNFIESGSPLLNKILCMENIKINQMRTLLEQKRKFEMELKSLASLSSEGDKEFEKLVNEETHNYLNAIRNVKNEILDSFVAAFDEDDNRNVEIHVIPGIGGDEAKLFAREIYNMYANYSLYKKWDCSYVDWKGDNFDSKHLYIYVTGDYAYKFLRHEGGVHKVQRVPENEKSGRTHSSTCSVSVLPQPKITEVNISPKDIILEKIRSSGPGGQNVNKTESCVRITHIPTGIVVENQTSRFQEENKKIAFKRLAGKLYNMEKDRIMSQLSSLKKRQVNLTEYSERVRTYNYIQNRVTDHRINYAHHDLRRFLMGNKELDETICKLIQFSRKNLILEHIYSVLETNEYKKFHQSARI